jgi:hypothetical protein
MVMIMISLWYRTWYSKVYYIINDIMYFMISYTISVYDIMSQTLLGTPEMSENSMIYQMI